MAQATRILDHTLDEHIEVNEYLNAIQVYKETLLRLSELHNNKNGNQQNQFRLTGITYSVN